jgi:hypothetical protein
MNKYLYLLNMESVYHIVTIRVNETSWAHVWRLRSLYLGMEYDKKVVFPVRHKYVYTPLVILDVVVMKVDIRLTCFMELIGS